MANEQSKKNYFDDFLAAKFEHIDYMFGQFREDVRGMRTDLSDFKNDVSSENRKMKNTLIATMVRTGIGVVLGLGAIVFAATQINTAWLTTSVQMFKHQ